MRDVRGYLAFQRALQLGRLTDEKNAGEKEESRLLDSE